MKEEPLISLKHEALTCLYIICKSFISNVNLIDQATPAIPPAPFLTPHPHTPLPISWQVCAYVCDSKETNRHTHCKGTHAAKVRPMSSGVQRPYLCIVLICVASGDRQGGPRESVGWVRGTLKGSVGQHMGPGWEGTAGWHAATCACIHRVWLIHIYANTHLCICMHIHTVQAGVWQTASPSICRATNHSDNTHNNRLDNEQ